MLKVPFQFWLLTALLVLVFVTGGSARLDVQSAVVLRPVSVLACAVALISLRREHLQKRAGLLAGFAVVFALAALHLVPLPPAIWEALPGRAEITAIDRIVGIEGTWRPFTITPMNGWHALTSLFTPLAILLFGIQLNREHLRRLLPVLILLGALSGFLGLLQVIGNPEGPLYFYRTTNNGNAVGLFANRNHAATYLACLFPMLAIFASARTDNDDAVRVRLLLAVAVGIVLIPLILVTGSRSGLVTSLLGLFGAAVLFRRPALNQKRQRAHSPVAGKAMLAGIAVLLLGLVTAFLARAEAINRLFSKSVVEDERWEFWKTSTGLFWKYFPLGSGSGSFVEAYQIVEPTNQLSASYLNHAHNDLLEVAVTFGLPGLIILAAASAGIVYAAWPLWRGDDRKRQSIRYGRMATIVIAMLAIACVSDYPLRTPILMSVFMIMALWLANAGDADGSPAVENRPKTTQRKREAFALPKVARVEVVRIAIISVAGLTATWFTFCLAVSGVTRTRNPEMALKFVPAESTALAARADEVLLPNMPTPPANVRELAMAALRAQAVNPGALRTLGYYTEVKGDTVKAEALIRQAEKMSRREVGAQIWLIEASVRKSDVAQALAHYDIALRTDSESYKLLYPTLLDALGDQNIRRALTPYIRDRQGWAANFLSYADGNSKDLPSLTALVLETGGLSDPKLSRDQLLELISRLVNEGYFAEARQLFVERLGMKSIYLRQLDFDTPAIDGKSGALGWRTVDDPTTGGGFSASADGKAVALSIFARTANLKLAASKVLYLPAGEYHFTARLSNLSLGDGGYIRWELKCATSPDRPAIWTADSRAAKVEAKITIPSSCGVQIFGIAASGGLDQTGLSATIENVSLRP